MDQPSSALCPKVWSAQTDCPHTASRRLYGDGRFGRRHIRYKLHGRLQRGSWRSAVYRALQQWGRARREPKPKLGPGDQYQPPFGRRGLTFTLDNSGNLTTPFYTFAQENRDPSLPANQINFYDFSKRNPTSLATTNPITWNASLYPVITTTGSTALTVENGVTWGWTMKKATVGSTSATFESPSGGVVTGVGTNSFTWGVGQPDVSSLTFTGQHFDTMPNTPFVLGELTYHNGTISSGTGADSVDFDSDISFDNVPEKNFDLSTTLQLISTVNTATILSPALTRSFWEISASPSMSLKARQHPWTCSPL